MHQQVALVNNQAAARSPWWTRHGIASMGHALAPGLLGLGVLAGALGFNLDLPFAVPQVADTQGMVVAATLLAMGLLLCRRRLHAALLLFGWYAGALAAMPAIWLAFFGNGWGAVAWLGLAALLVAPTLLGPRHRPAVGAVIAITAAAVPPLGMVGLCNPLLAAGALFPGAGWLGLGLTLVFFGLSAYRSRWAQLVQLAMVMFAMVTLGTPAPAAPDFAWPALTNHGEYPTGLSASFARQDEAKHAVERAVSEGARLILMPEGTNPSWDDGQAYYWDSTRRAADTAHAQVLMGVYTSPLQGQRQNGILDLSTGELYPASISMPIAMWRPWQSADFRGRLSRPALIPTAAGPAAHLVCYEELLPWALALQEFGQSPKVLISVANQWFVRGWIGRPQSRSIALQARLWGLPLLRSVNGPAFDL